jgi:thiol-disulfide isomerase/thioredoxin
LRRHARLRYALRRTFDLWPNLNRTNLLIVAVAVIGALLGLFASSGMDALFAPPVPAGVEVLKVGDARADLEFVDLAGKQHRLSEWDGKVVLINFWATWCGPCREEMPLLDATRARLAPKGFEVLGVAIDDAQAVQEFLKDSPVRYPILLADESGDDPSLRFGDTRSVLPFSVLIGRDGKLIAQRAGNFSDAALADWIAPHLVN